MMRRLLLRREWLWVLLILALISAPYWWHAPLVERSHSSLSNAAAGKKAFYLLVRKLFDDVSRQIDGPLVPWDDADTLCIVGPNRPPTPSEWRALHDWVADGRTLFYAQRRSDPEVDLGPFEVWIEPHLTVEGDGEAGGDRKTFESVLVTGPIPWRSDATIAGTYDDVLVNSARGPQAVIKEVGRGLLVVCASDHIFTNIVLAQPNGSRLAARLLETGEIRGPVVIDETLGAGGTQVLRLLFSALLLPFTVQLLICSAVFLWMGHFRFGPALPLPDRRRREFTEHAMALGNLHLKTGDGRELVRAYWEHLRRHLRITGRSGAVSSLARRARVDEDGVRRLVASIETPGALPVGQATTLIRELARLRRRIQGTRSE